MRRRGIDVGGGGRRLTMRFGGGGASAGLFGGGGASEGGAGAGAEGACAESTFRLLNKPTAMARGLFRVP